MSMSVAGHSFRMIAGVVPATLTVLFAGIIALTALALGDDRRQYALDLADRFVTLAAVLVGWTPIVSPDDSQRPALAPCVDLRRRD